MAKIISALVKGSAKVKIDTIEKPFWALQFNFKFLNIYNLFKKFGFSPELNNITLQDFFNALIKTSEGGNPSILVTAILESKDGKKDWRFDNVNLFSLLEHAQIKGVAQIVLDVNFDNNDEGILRCTLPMGNPGSLTFNEDERLILEVTYNGFPVLVNSHFGNLDVFTLESVERATTYNKYEKINILSGQANRQIPVSNYESLMIPRSAIDSTFELLVTGTNGLQARYESQELFSLTTITNDALINLGGWSLPGFGNYVILNVEAYTFIEIRRQVTTAFEILAVDENVSINAVSAIDSNNALISPKIG